MTSTRAPRANALRHLLPAIAGVTAVVMAVVVLPSALRPPPDPSNISGALNPNAPPDNSNQLIESLQQAGGGGAGSAPVKATAAPTARPSASATKAPIATPTPGPPSLGFCYGKPPRQVPSVYSGPCVGAWQGKNGGATAKNVFPNEVRIGFQGTGVPDAGRLPEANTDTSATTNATVTWQLMEEYFNKHFQTYGRRIKFYGVPAPSSSSDADAEANATQAADTYQLFTQENTVVSACKAFARKHLNVSCDAMTHAEYQAQQPYLSSEFMEIDQIQGFGAEYACKTLAGKAARYGGNDVNGKPRKYAFLAYHGGKGGADGSMFARLIKQECGLDVEVATLNDDQDAQGAAAAITRFRADGVTTVIFHNQLINVLLAMQQADSLSYTPEWVMLGEYGMDLNTIGATLPPRQSRHLFGISTSFEWPQAPANTECVQALRTLQPGFSPDSSACSFWQRAMFMVDGIQGAGPHLTPVTYNNALGAMGHRFGLAPWMLGGGFGPGDYSWTDDVGTVWWSATAIDPGAGAPGAFVWTHGGKRFQRGQLPRGEDPQLFVGGSARAPAS